MHYSTKVRLITKEAPNFSELRKDEVRRILFLGTSVNKDRQKLQLYKSTACQRSLTSLLVAED